MAEMTSRERFLRAYAHKEADRVPITDTPWAGTIRRWQKEGMPLGADWQDYFGVDRVFTMWTDITPQYEVKILEETDRYIIHTTEWGATLKSFKAQDSTPEFLDYKVSTPEAWEEAKARMKPSPDRIDWKGIDARYKLAKEKGDYIEAHFWFGFDVTHSWMAGLENVLCGMYDYPDWIKDMFNTYLDMCIAQFDMIWDAGYHFDSITWPDDLGYKGTTFFSKNMYREFLKPVHKRAVDWAHNKGILAHLHSCGDVMSFVPEFVDIGVDGLNPLEIKAGMDPIQLKKEYGDVLTLHGGINAVLWDNKEAIISEINRLVPVLKENGGYIFSSDHSIPNSVSLENFRAIVEAVKAAGKFG